MTTQPTRSVSIYLSYAQEDEALKKEFEDYLAIMQQGQVISGWIERQIQHGTDWSHVIDPRLLAADLVLVFLSPRLLSSGYCSGAEVRAMFEKNSRGEARVLPIILRKVDLAGSPFASVQSVPSNGGPVASRSKRDDAWWEIDRAIRRAIGYITGERYHVRPYGRRISRNRGISDDVSQEKREVTTAMSIDQSSVQTELFRPALTYPVQLYDQMLTRTAERYPEHIAILFNDVNLSYRELEALVNIFANALLELGIHKGQQVCIFMTNRAEYIISWFAIMRVGAAVSPINPSYKDREVVYQIANSESVALIVQDHLLPMIEANRAEMPGLLSVIVVGSERHDPAAQIYSFSQLLRTHTPVSPPRPDVAWEEMAALPYSSGTTGLPKGVMLSHKNLVCNAYQSIATARITSEDRMLVFLPLYHIYGIMLMGCAVMSGARLVLMERFEPERVLQLIQGQGITLLYTVPQVLASLSAWPQLDSYDLHTVRFTQCGAAPVPPVLAHRFQERTRITVMTSYGLTEAAPGTHSNPVYDRRLIKVETIGLPIHDTRQKIVDVETGQHELGVDEVGELIVQGPQVMQGYWKAPEETSDALRDGWLYTGDIGSRDAAGYVTITDRKKEMIKVKGFSVAPAQIEALFLEHPAVADVAVIARPDEEAGEVPKAFVVLHVDSVQLSAAELLVWANGKLATFKNVREVEFIDAIPRNPSGKILRRILKQLELQRLGLL